MWLKKRHAPSAEIPKLRDEYRKLLKDTLSEVRPLQDVTQPARPCGPPRLVTAVEQTTWQEHQRALRPHLPTSLPRSRQASLASRGERRFVPAGCPG